MGKFRCTYTIEASTTTDRGGKHFEVARRWINQRKAETAAKAYIVAHPDRTVMVVERCSRGTILEERNVYWCRPKDYPSSKMSPRCGRPPKARAAKGEAWTNLRE